MDKIPKLALVLFDIDGCTAIVTTSKIRTSCKLAPGSQCILSHSKTDYKIEVLQLSDSKPALNRFEKDWAKLERARALDKEKEERGHAEHGYLMVLPKEVDLVEHEENERERPDFAPHQIMGSNNRSVSVLYQGSGQTDQNYARPQRQPVYLTDLGEDERDCVVAQVNDHEKFRRSFGTQTEDVLIFKNKEELLESYDPKGRSLSDLFTMINSNGGNLSEIVDVVNEMRNGVLHEILGILRGLKEDRDVSKIIHMGLLNDLESSTESAEDLSEEDTVEDVTHSKIDIVINENNESNHFDAYEYIYEHTDQFDENQQPGDFSAGKNHQPGDVSAGKNQQPGDVSAGKNNQPGDVNARKNQQPGDVSAEKNQLPGDVSAEKNQQPGDVSAEKNQLPGEITVGNNLQPGDVSVGKNQQPGNVSVGKNQQPGDVSARKNQQRNDVSDENQQPGDVSARKKQLVPRSSPLRAEGFSHLLQCNSGPIVEISSYEDMEQVDMNSEVRIAPFVQRQFQTAAGWPGSFAWQLAQKIYKPEELMGRNYYGKLQKPSLSPRRRHALEHAVLENLGDDSMSLRKAVEGINTGIRNKTHKLKVKSNKPVPHPLLVIDNNKL